jgi:branched-chain amino acid aminotransferase
MKHTFLPTAYLQGKFIDFNDANISIATHALHYGTASFGGIRGMVDEANPTEAIVTRLSDHTKRLSDSAKYLQADFTQQQVEQVIVEFIKRNKPGKPFYVRPLIYTSDTGIAPRLHEVEKDLLIYGIEAGDYLPPEGVSVCFSSWMRQPDASLPLRGKISGAYVTSSMAKTEAVARGFDEAIMLNVGGKVSEASAMNLFMVRDGALITPGVDQDILEGITRKSIITMAKDLGISVIERPVDKTELYIADEFFLCGSMARITPVNSVEHRPLPKEHPITDQLRTLLTAISKNQSQKYSAWSDVITY